VAFKTPQKASAATAVSGMRKANLSWDRALVGGFLGGAYIASGSLVAIAVSSGLAPATWGTLPTLFISAVFTLGLVLVVVAGAELLTGNVALLPAAHFRRRITLAQLGVNSGLVFVGNLLGSLFVAQFLAYKTGIIGASAAAAGSAGLEYTRAVARWATSSAPRTDLGPRAEQPGPRVPRQPRGRRVLRCRLLLVPAPARHRGPRGRAARRRLPGRGSRSTSRADWRRG